MSVSILCRVVWQERGKLKLDMQLWKKLLENSNPAFVTYQLCDFLQMTQPLCAQFLHLHSRDDNKTSLIGL